VKRNGKFLRKTQKSTIILFAQLPSAETPQTFTFSLQLTKYDLCGKIFGGINFVLPDKIFF